MASSLEDQFGKLVDNFNKLRDPETTQEGVRNLYEVLDENVIIHGIHHQHTISGISRVIRFMKNSNGMFKPDAGAINCSQHPNGKYGYVTGTGIWNDDDDKDALIHIAFVFIKPGTDKRRVWQAIRLWGSNADGRQ